MPAETDREMAAVIALVTGILQDVCELPYTSPDDQPELLQCTTLELAGILENRLTAALSAARAAGREEALECVQDQISCLHSRCKICNRLRAAETAIRALKDQTP